MRLRQVPPELPPDLLDRFGMPENIFGPNLRFRRTSAIVGGVLVLLGLMFCLAWAAVIARGMPGAQVWLLSGGGLIVSGLAAALIPRRVQLTWVFVCPHGLVRARGADWNAVEWDDVVRVENASSSAGVSITQCRVVLSDGKEWGFLADYVADCGRLIEILRRTVAERG